MARKVQTQDLNKSTKGAPWFLVVVLLRFVTIILFLFVTLFNLGSSYIIILHRQFENIHHVSMYHEAYI